MSDKFFVGPAVTGVEDNGKQRPISRVTLWLDDENCLTAGNDTGFELEADCPHATQTMVNSILSKLEGYQYQMFTADAASLDPSAELGDGVTTGGMYSVLARISEDGSGFPSISAPGEAELEDEYPAGGPMTQTFDRKIAETRSSIEKTAESITLMVENEVSGLNSKLELTSTSLTSEINETKDELSSRIEQTAESLTTQITDANDNISSIQQYVDSITLSVTNGSTSSTIELKAGSATISSKSITFDGFVTFTGLSGGTTTIDGACIKTGTIDAERLNLSGAITWGDLSEDVQDDIDGAYDAASSVDTALENLKKNINYTYIDGEYVISPNIVGATIKGGKFYNTIGNAYLEVGGSEQGDLILHGSGNNNVFSVIDGVGAASIGIYDNDFLSATAEKTYAQGVWDFNNATVYGLYAKFG